MGLRAHPLHQQKILEVRRFFVLLFLRFPLTLITGQQHLLS